VTWVQINFDKKVIIKDVMLSGVETYIISEKRLI